MGYLRNRMARRSRPSRPLSGLGDLISSIESALGTGVNIAGDPYLPEVVCHIDQLQQINAGGSPGTCAETPDGLPGGIGLATAVKPMRAYVWAEAHKPWSWLALAGLVVGVPLFIGYELGKG